MNWYEDLYIGKTAQKKKDRLIGRIEAGKAPAGVWLITLASGSVNQLELFSALNMKFWYRKKECPMIVGLACGREEALDLVLKMAEDSLAATGRAGFREFFGRLKGADGENNCRL